MNGSSRSIANTRKNARRAAWLPMKWMPLPDGTWTVFSKNRRKNSGGSLEQYKHPCLVPDLEFGSKLFIEMAAVGMSALPENSTGDAPAILHR